MFGRAVFVGRGLESLDLARYFLLHLLCFALLVALAHGYLFQWKVTLTASPFSLMGVSLALFLGFRINASYDRYWEGRKLWGAVLVESRNLARQALTLTTRDCETRPFVLGLSAFAAAMRNQLRGQAPDTGLAGLLPPEVLARVTRVRLVPMAVALWLGGQLRDWRERGQLQPDLAVKLEQSLDLLTAALGGCERIASTPLPSMATTTGVRGTSASAATADAAAVRMAVMVLPSITAKVWPVAGSINTMVLSSVGKPFCALPGTSVMSLVPGPTEPMTKRGRSKLRATSLAREAACTLRS